MMSQRILIALILVCFFVGNTFTAAETVVIEVGGGGPDNLKFVPQEVTANKGDTILWKFLGGNHNVVESMGKHSCEQKEEDPTAFRSLTNPPTGNFTLDITSEKAVITYMCSVGSHCSAGMWGVIYVGGTEPPTFVKPTPPNSSKDNANSAENAMENNSGKVSGIVIGSIIGFAMVSALGFLLAKRCRSKQRTVPTVEGIKKVVDNTDQTTKDHQAKLENV